MRLGAPREFASPAEAGQLKYKTKGKVEFPPSSTPAGGAKDGRLKRGRGGRRGKARLETSERLREQREEYEREKERKGKGDSRVKSRRR